MNECIMMVVIRADSYCALTTLHMTRITSLTDILFLNFLTNMVFAFSDNSNQQTEIAGGGCQAA
jgi:hypothetical protein